MMDVCVSAGPARRNIWEREASGGSVRVAESEGRRDTRLADNGQEQSSRKEQFRRSDTQSRVQRAEITVWAGPCSLRKLQQGICFLAFFASRVAFLGSGLPLPSSKPASQHRQESFFSPTSHSPLRKAL
uniref:Uncharacterized protein n=1 Tax=Molossus molossus TaxID=27622 RepID=A0A7J8CS28_MOLMO|nr:hypothetical protein HJG59_009819 [Molossus molossus]